MNDKLIRNNTLIITDSKNKDYIIKYISSLNILSNVKVITNSEFLKSYYFDYDEKTILYLMKKYNIKPSVARIYVNNMYYINKTDSNNKIKKIYDLKKELIDNKLLKINNYFREFLKTRNIVLYNFNYVPNIIKNALNDYEYEVVNNDLFSYQHNIYEFNTLDEEVEFVACKCIDLIKNNVDINKIYLTNLNDEYRLIIKRIFSIYKIPVYLNDEYSIYNTHTSNLFLNLYSSNISDTLEQLSSKITKDEEDIYNKIVNICNKYVWCSDYLDVKELIIDDLKQTNIKKNIIDNCVKEVDININILDDEYVFLLGFNQGVIPIIHKDEEYLNDKEKMLLGLETSIENNLIEKDNIIKKVSSIKNLYITYKLKSLSDTFSISNINDELNYEVFRNEVKGYNYSNLCNKLSLSKALDVFNKYGIISNDLSFLYNNYSKLEYRKYDNKFKGIDVKDLYKYLDNKLLLSYSSLDNYNRCNFRYYLNNILKISPYEETFMQLIGNLFHYVLSKAFLPDFNYDECFDNYIKRELSKKEIFFIKKLKEELKFIIDTIKQHNSHTMLNEELYEDKVYINLEGNIKVTFMGIIDKLKYKKVNDKYVIAIIDYKTGNPNLNLNDVVYGIEMQLPIYIYLTRNHPKFNNNIEVAGFYLQKILNNEIVADKKSTYDDLKRKNLLLQGYSNSNVDILELFDDSYLDSSVIKSLKMSSKGFYSYSKIIDNDTINKLVEITEEKIKESSNSILDGKFDINPKRIGTENKGCEFCSFKDICFKTEKDIVNLKEYKNLEFLGGDDNGMD